jgi:glutamate carboxypeptidase
MQKYSPHLAWIDTQHERMCRLLTEWASINSGTYHLAGLERCADAVMRELAGLGGEMQRVDLPPQPWVQTSGEVIDRPLGRAIHLKRRRDVPLQMLLAIHFDTVYGADGPFQAVTRLDANTLHGPGVVDAKGGLVVLLVALEALERSPWADRVGWEVLLNPDEEIGSPGSGPLFSEAASRNSLGLLFEPAQPRGWMAAGRKASGNFTAVMRGRAAHAGRDPHAGRNAIHALSEFVVSVASLNSPDEGISANVGRIEGGTAPNVVPDLAICRFNVRVRTPQQQEYVDARLAEWAAALNDREGFSLRLHGEFSAPAKVVDGPTLRLLEHVASCGKQLGLDIGWRDTGGVCDGNRLAAAGLPNVDTLGVRGGNLHSLGEFMLLDSLTERAKLAALLMMRLASGELPWPAEKTET